MSLGTFQRDIEVAVKKKLKLKINNNRSTMLSVKWEPDCTKVSLHRIFLEAPKNIMNDLACHIRKENSDVSPKVRAYIEEKLKGLDFSDRLPKEGLVTQGEFYNLEEIYQSINREYFNNEVDLWITWYGKLNPTNKSRVTFGLYQEQMRLIKIHRMMDRSRRFIRRPYFPDFFVSYVVFHEMLHHVCPSYVDENGRLSIHTKEFKMREREFKDFDLAQKWLERNRDNFFR